MSRDDIGPGTILATTTKRRRFYNPLLGRPACLRGSEGARQIRAQSFRSRIGLETSAKGRRKAYWRDRQRSTLTKVSDLFSHRRTSVFGAKRLSPGASGKVWNPPIPGLIGYA